MNFIKNIFKAIRNILLILLLVLLLIFMISNRQIIEINFSPLPFNASIRIFTLMISCFALGIIFSMIIFSKKFVKNFFMSFKNQSKIKKLEKQVLIQNEIIK